MAPFRGRPIVEQEPFRSAQIESALAESGHDVYELHAVAGRGGLLPPLASGTYIVNQAMLEELRRAKRGEHASNLGAFLAHSIGQKAGVEAYVVDPVSVDEWPDSARLSGTALIERQCLSHALNSKAVAKRHARETGRAYELLQLIVAHLGSGISVSAHKNGRMIDVTNSREEGAFSTERAGGVPSMQLVDLCFSGNYTRGQVEELLFRQAGLYSYLGTRDVEEVERRMAFGESKASIVYEAMVHQIAKEIGAMATVLNGTVDALLFTGGMAHSRKLVAAVTERVGWIAPIVVFPGEDELQALAEGVLRALRHEEEVRVFGPAGA
jgi:butyrate kinase